MDFQEKCLEYRKVSEILLEKNGNDDINCFSEKEINNYLILYQLGDFKHSY